MIIANEDNNLFLVRAAIHAKYLSNLIKKAKSEPESNTEATYLMERFFAQFDLGSAKRWTDFQSKYPKYNPKSFKWADYELETPRDSNEKEATDGLSDPEHHKLPPFRQSLSQDFGELPDTPTNNQDTVTSTSPKNTDRTEEGENPDEDDDLFILSQKEAQVTNNEEESKQSADDQQNSNQTTPISTTKPGSNTTNQPIQFLAVIDSWINKYEQYEKKVGTIAAQPIIIDSKSFHTLQPSFIVSMGSTLNECLSSLTVVEC